MDGERCRGVICDRKVSAKVKRKVYETAVRPAMMYGLETVAVTKWHEAELEVVKLKMLRFAMGVTRLGKIRNEYIRGTAHIDRFGCKLRESRLRWFGHVQRRDEDHVGKRTMRMELPGRRRRGRPKRRYMDMVKEDLRVIGAVEEDVFDRMRWGRMIRCSDL